MSKEVKHIYILHVERKIAAYRQLSNGRCMYSFAEPENFIDFCKGLRESYPDFKLRCIKNKGLEDFLKKKLHQQENIEKLINKNRGER